MRGKGAQRGPVRWKDLERFDIASQEIQLMLGNMASCLDDIGRNVDNFAKRIQCAILVGASELDGRGRHLTANVPGDFAVDCGTMAAATTSASVRRSIVMRSRATDESSAPE